MTTERIDWTKGPLPENACVMGRAGLSWGDDGSIDGWFEVANVPGSHRVPDKGEHIDPHLFMPSMLSCRCIVTSTSFGQPGPLFIQFSEKAKP